MKPKQAKRLVKLLAKEISKHIVDHMDDIKFDLNLYRPNDSGDYSGQWSNKNKVGFEHAPWPADDAPDEASDKDGRLEIKSVGMDFQTNPYYAPTKSDNDRDAFGETKHSWACYYMTDDKKKIRLEGKIVTWLGELMLGKGNNDMVLEDKFVFRRENGLTRIELPVRLNDSKS